MNNFQGGNGTFHGRTGFLKHSAIVKKENDKLSELLEQYNSDLYDSDEDEEIKSFIVITEPDYEFDK